MTIRPTLYPVAQVSLVQRIVTWATGSSCKGASFSGFQKSATAPTD